jgi:drug/metabolite transporter (DMT)-like permease
MGANIAFVHAASGAFLILVAVIASLYPAVTVVLAWLILGHRLTPGQVAGVTLAVVSVALIAVA